MTPTLWTHQTAALEFAAPKRAAMLAMHMGTGKSKVAIELIKARRHLRTLVLAPLSVVSVWPRQLAIHAGDSISCLPLDCGSVPARRKKLDEFLLQIERSGRPGVVVLNYDAAWRRAIGNLLLTVGWDLLVLDEAHRLKSPFGKASSFAFHLSMRAPHRLALTGTPMPHSPLDIWAQYRCLDASLFGGNYHAFRAKYAVLGGYEGRQVVGFRNLDDLHAKFHKLAYRCGPEVLSLLPAIHETRTVKLGPKAASVYADLEEHFLAWLEEGQVSVANALVKLLRLQQVTSGYAMSDDGVTIHIDDGKVKALADILEDMDSAEPVVVFCRFRHDLDAVHNAAASVGRRCLELSGRENDLSDWQGDKTGSVLAVQIQAGGVGVDLTRARYTCFYSLGFSLGEYLQALARVHRPGQERGVVYYHLVAQGTVDELVYERLAKREEVIEGVLSGLKQKRGTVRAN